MQVSNQEVFRWWDYVIFSILTAATWVALAVFSKAWVDLPDWSGEPFLRTLAALLIARYFLIHQLRWFSLLLMRRAGVMPPLENVSIAAVTTFVPAVESIDMLERTLRAISAMSIDHENWVLDEGDNDDVKALCARLGARHYTRRGKAELNTESGVFAARTKYGNYNAWLHEVGFEGDYELVACFDPDHVAKPEYLQRTTGYFADAEVGYVQPAQVYYNQNASFIARGAAEETYSYYSTIQMAYHGLGHPVVTGCHQVHRVSALKELGGLAPHDADDLLTAHWYRAAGWKGVYVAEVLAVGITPVDWPGYLRQQRRWAHSVLDIKIRHLRRVAGRLPLQDKLVAFLHGLYYLQGLGVLFGLSLLCWVLASNYTPKFIGMSTLSTGVVLLVMLRLSEFYKQRFFLLPRREWGLHWRAAILQFAKWPFLLLAFFDAVRGHAKPYVLTTKLTTRHGQPRMLTWPHLVTIVVVTVSWGWGYLHGADPRWLLEVTSLFTVGTSVWLIWSEGLEYPPSYDGALYEEYVRAEGEEVHVQNQPSAT